LETSPEELPPRPPLNPMQTQETLDRRLSLSREARAARNRVDEDWRVRVPVSAGAHVVTATFRNRTSALKETLRLPFERPYPSGVNIAEQRSGAYLLGVEISGPYDVAGPGETRSREEIFVCLPDEADSLSPESVRCAERIIERLARRAYRRDVGESDLSPLLEFYRQGAAESFDAGIQRALNALLVAPEFL